MDDDQTITYRHLTENEFPRIHECFLESFKDYQLNVKYMTREVMRRRFQMGRVDYESSVGAFAGDRMVGLTMVGVDDWNGEPHAFDAATGIIQEYRGRGVAGAMFKFALPRLKSMGIAHFMLEVLQDNQAAIRAYEKAGFSITRDFTCFRIQREDIQEGVDTLPGVEIKPVTKGELERYLGFMDYQVSWEYTYSAITCIENELIIDGAFVDGECVAYIVFYPTMNWIFTLATKDGHRDRGIENMLLSNILSKVKPDAPHVSYNNLVSGHGLCELMEKSGFDVYTRQYEMVCNL